MPNNIQIGSITIHMYGVMIALGLCAAVVVSTLRARKLKLSEDMIYNILWFSILGGFLGTRILYYITVLPSIMKDPSILWDFANGYVVYGGIIGGVLVNLLYFKWRKINFLPYFDLIMPQVALAQAFGRIGCLFAGCCYGKETKLPIGFTYHTSDYAPVGHALMPTQIISSFGDFCIFLLLLAYTKKSKAKGTVGAMYLMLYSVGRFFIEFLRGDEARGFVGFVSTSQIIAVVLFVLGLLLFVVFSGLYGKTGLVEKQEDATVAEKDE